MLDSDDTVPQNIAAGVVSTFTSKELPRGQRLHIASVRIYSGTIAGAPTAKLQLSMGGKTVDLTPVFTIGAASGITWNGDKLIDGNDAKLLCLATSSENMTATVMRFAWGTD